LDAEDRVLYESGQRVPLTPKVLDTLAALVEMHGRIVEKEELIKRVWPDTFVEEGNLTVNIFLLRKVLAKRFDGVTCIETVPKRGYCFVAPVKQIRSEANGGITEPNPPQSNSESFAFNAPQPVSPLPNGPGPVAVEGAAEVSAAPKTPILESAHAPHKRRTIFWSAALAMVCAAMLVGLNLGGLRNRLFNGSSIGQIRSIAVLPLENLSGDPGQEYFADGMTDELITDLARVKSLRVVSRTSIMRYKGKRESLPQIGRELNVDAILEGSVVRSGARVRITAQLIQVSTDQHIWAQAYDRELQDILALQNEVAQDITRKIQIELTPQDRIHPIPHSVNPEAYEAYLRGRFQLTRQDPQAFKEALAQFQHALELDPLFAPAYSGLSDTYNLFANYGVLSAKEAFPRAEAAANKALQLDNSLAEAHASLGFIKNHYDWDWAGAEREYKEAIALSPSYAVAHLRYAEFLSTVARHDEALKEIRIAQQLDPLSRVIGSNIGRILYHARRNDEAIGELRKALDLDPRSVYTRETLGMAYESKGMYNEAERELLVVQASMGNGPLCALAHVYAVSGKPEIARQMLRELGPNAVSCFFIAGIYAALHQNDQAFANLSKAYESHDFFLSFIKVHSYMDPLRADPRFQDMLSRLGMPK
jgi:TolB-like protein/DNA-binding winged helix-turn-helix (wHTH) protein/Tfp pilus assembly protein PilF